VNQEHLEFKEKLDQLVELAQLDQLVLAEQDHPDQLVNLVLWVQLDLQDRQDLLDHEVRQVHRVKPAHREREDQQDLLVQEVQRENLDQWVNLAKLGQVVLMDRSDDQDLRDREENQDREESLEVEVNLVHLDRLALKEKEAHLDQVAYEVK
jgi:hypothetical protein